MVVAASAGNKEPAVIGSEAAVQLASVAVARTLPFPQVFPTAKVNYIMTGISELQI